MDTQEQTLLLLSLPLPVFQKAVLPVESLLEVLLQSLLLTLQVVYHDSMENFEEISKLNVGAAVIVTGLLVATPQAKQPFEIQAHW